MLVRPRRWYLSVCGLDCSRCTIHLRTNEELDFWRSQNADLDKVRCDCCRSERQEGRHWSWDCRLVECCIGRKGFEFCAQCADLDSCPLIKDFAEPMEHHRAAVARLKEMKRIGVERWLSDHGYGSQSARRESVRWRDRMNNAAGNLHRRDTALTVTLFPFVSPGAAAGFRPPI